MERPGTWFALPMAHKVGCRNMLCIRATDDSHYTVVWTKNNPTPWNTVKPEENTKMMAVNQKFEKSCVLLLSFNRCKYLNSYSSVGRGTGYRGFPRRFIVVFCIPHVLCIDMESKSIPSNSFLLPEILLIVTGS